MMLVAFSPNGFGLCVRWRLKPQMLNLKTNIYMSTNDELKNETANGTKPVSCEVKMPCCERCNGTGLSPDGKGYSDTPYVCSKCNGSGLY